MSDTRKRKPCTAFGLWRAGLCVIPIRPGTKKAAVRWEDYQKERPSKQQIEAWFRGKMGGPGENYLAWGVITGAVSGVIVVDLDSQEALEWGQKHLPYTPLRVCTSSKPDGFLGRHWYYRHPGGDLIVSNRARVVTPEGVKIALDLRGDGGYVLGPGSLHPEGCVYQASTEVTPEILQQLPVYDVSWLQTGHGEASLVHGGGSEGSVSMEVGASGFSGLSMEVGPRSGRGAEAPSSAEALEFVVHRVTQYLEAIPGEGKGNRNNQAFQVAAKISNDFGLDTPEGFGLFEAWNQKNSPPLDRKELETTWKSALKGAKQVRGNKLDTGYTPDYRPKVYDVRTGHRAEIPGGGTGSATDVAPGTEPSWRVPDSLEVKPSTLPPFPHHVLPSWGYDMVEAVSLAYQVPLDLPGMLFFAALSTALAGKVVFEYAPDWVESANLYCCVAMESGTRKSPVFSRMVAPIERYEEILRAKAEDAKASHEVALKLLKSDLRKAELELEGLARGDRSDQQLSHLAALQRELATLERKKVPDQLSTVDVTPEKLGELLRDNGERMAILSSEADFFSVLGGRYNRGESNLGLFLEAWSGRPYRVDRKGGAIHLKAPILSLGVTTQPSTLAGIIHRPGWKEIGVPGRLLFALPHDNVGHRSISPPPVPSHVETSYSLGLMKLLDIPIPEGMEVPRLRFDSEAKEAFEQFRAWHEALLRPDGRLRDLREWGAKLPGQLIRIAGLIHVAENGVRGSIGLVTVLRTLDLAAHLIEHACAVFLKMGADSTESAKRLLNWIKREQPSMFTASQVVQALRRVFPNVGETEPALDLLESTGHVKALWSPPGPGGGRPTVRYLVNPVLLGREDGGPITIPEGDLHTTPPEEDTVSILPTVENSENIDTLTNVAELLPEDCQSVSVRAQLMGVPMVELDL